MSNDQPTLGEFRCMRNAAAATLVLSEDQMPGACIATIEQLQP